METILLEFVDTLDALLKRVQAETGTAPGLARLTLNQIGYLETIHALGDPKVSEIAAHMHITRASATAGVHKLVQLGYASMRQSGQDRRVYYVSLTEASRQLVRAKAQTLQEYDRLISAALSPAEIQQLDASLAKIIQVFKLSGSAQP
jgi:DNA-binding MarR family transcriptional regulator